MSPCWPAGRAGFPQILCVRNLSLTTWTCAPQQVQGQSFLPLCLGQKQERKPYIVSEFHGSHMGFYTIRSIRTEKYKYIFHTGADDEFYDLSEDPYEMSNRIEWPEYADVVKELKLHLVEWMRETRDHLYTEDMVY